MATNRKLTPGRRSLLQKHEVKFQEQVMDGIFPDGTIRYVYRQRSYVPKRYEYRQQFSGTVSSTTQKK